MALLGKTQNYWLGNGSLYISDIKTDGTYGPERHLGTITDFNLSVSVEKYDYSTSNCGPKTKVVDVPVTTDRSGTFTTDDTNWENLAMGLGGDLTQRVQTLSTVTGEDIEDIEVGYHYPLGVTANNPVGVNNKITNLVVRKGAATLTAGTRVKNGIAPTNADYVADMDRGIIEILTTGSLLDADDIECDYDVVAGTTIRFEAGGNIGGLKKLRFKACNSGVGEDRDVILPRVSVSPAADIAFKSEAVATIGFDLEILEPHNGLPAIIIDGRAA